VHTWPAWPACPVKCVEMGGLVGQAVTPVLGAGAGGCHAVRVRACLLGLGRYWGAVRSVRAC